MPRGTQVTERPHEPDQVAVGEPGAGFASADHSLKGLRKEVGGDRVEHVGRLTVPHPDREVRFWGVDAALDDDLREVAVQRVLPAVDVTLAEVRAQLVTVLQPSEGHRAVPG